MEHSWLSLAVPASLVVGFLLYRRMGQVRPEEARRLVEEGAKLVDVRTRGEFSGGHLPGAMNIPLQELGAKAESLGAKDRPVVLYCASGSRSSMARTVLKRLGFTEVFNLGPMSRW